MNAFERTVAKVASFVPSAVREAVARLHLSRKVVTQGATAALAFVVALAVHRWHASVPAGYVPVIAGLIAGYLVPESPNAPVPAKPAA